MAAAPLCLLLAGAGLPPPPPPPPALAGGPALLVVVKAARILDVPRGTYLRDSAILVRGGRIEAVIPGTGKPPRGARVIDLGGATLLPGLIDLHVHLALSAAPTDGSLHGAAEAERTLRAGFTTVRDLGAAGLANVELARAIEAGRVSGPRVIAAGPGMGPPGGVCGQVFGPSGAASTADEAAAVVGRLIDSGAGVLKVCAGGGVFPGGGGPERELPDGMAKAVVAAARARGRTVAAHATTPAAVVDAIDAGVHSIEHGGVLDDATIARLAKSGVTLVPTLARLDWALEQQASRPATTLSGGTWPPGAIRPTSPSVGRSPPGCAWGSGPTPRSFPTASTPASSGPWARWGSGRRRPSAPRRSPPRSCSAWRTAWAGSPPASMRTSSRWRATRWRTWESWSASASS
jgi:hypothetical protein